MHEQSCIVHSTGFAVSFQRSIVLRRVLRSQISYFLAKPTLSPGRVIFFFRIPVLNPFDVSLNTLNADRIKICAKHF